tara:strand:+ start:556 stop:1452 length:897 start_codon:yes stop_codon:yes gene_type:complete
MARTIVANTYNTGGAAEDIDLQSNGSSKLLYDQSDDQWELSAPLDAGGNAMTMPRNQNLTIVIANGATSSIVVTADLLTLFNSSNLGIIKDFSAGYTILEANDSGGTNGLLGLDTGAWSADAYYYVYAVSDGTNLSAMCSLQSKFSDITLTGNFATYTYGKLIGAVQFKSGTSFYESYQRDNVFHQEVKGDLLNGSIATALTAIDTTLYVSKLAVSVDWFIKANDNGADTTVSLQLSPTNDASFPVIKLGHNGAGGWEEFGTVSVPMWISGATGIYSSSSNTNDALQAYKVVEYFNVM